MSLEPPALLKPLPPVDSITEEFWARCAQQELCVQVCEACGATQFYPRFACCACQSVSLRLTPSTGYGVVQSFTIIRRAVSSAFDADVPYVVALIQLSDGPTMMSNVVNTDPEQVTIGMQVEVVFEQRGARVLPQFQPRSAD